MVAAEAVFAPRGFMTPLLLCLIVTSAERRERGAAHSWRTAGAERISGRSECAAEREWSEREGRRGMIGLAPSGGTAVTEKRRGTRNRRPP